MNQKILPRAQRGAVREAAGVCADGAVCRHYIKKYNRYEKRHKNVPAHVSPAFKLNVGDNIIVGQCRPLSKTVRFNVLSVVSEAAGAKSFSKY